MKLYRVESFDNDDSSMGFVWFTSKKQVLDFCKQTEDEEERPDEDIVTVDIPLPLTKKSLLSILNKYAAHPDNG